MRSEIFEILDYLDMQAVGEIDDMPFDEIGEWSPLDALDSGLMIEEAETFDAPGAQA